MNRRFNFKTAHAMKQIHERSPATQPRATAPEAQSPGQELLPEHELACRLKAAIDARGRYSFRLADMASGLAAGRNIPHAVARKTIEDNFARQFGHSPQEYLDQHYEQRRELGLAPSRSPQRSQGRGR